MFHQGIEDTQQRKLANLFLYEDNGKDLLGVVYPYFNRDSCYCLVCVFYHNRSTRWIEWSVVMQKKNLDDEKQKKPVDSDDFSEVELEH